MIWRSIKQWLSGAGAGTGGTAKKLSAEELAGLVDRGERVLYLDIRSAQEIQELGSVLDHAHIPLDQLAARAGELPRDRPIVTL